MRYPQEYENNSIIILDDLNEKEINNEKIQAMFKRGRYNNLSIYISSAKITMNYQKEQYAAMEMFFIYLNRIYTLMFAVFIKIKLQWI